MSYRTIVAALLSVSLWAGTSLGDTYKIDAAHADIGFTVKHLGISKVRGKFKEFSGSLDYDGKKMSSLAGRATIQAASIDTGIAKRDEHLRNADYFDVAKFPEITFESKGIHKHGAEQHLTGVLTIKGVSKDIKLSVAVSGPVDHPFQQGAKVIGFSGTTQIDRHDFGVAAKGPTDKLIGDTINIEINLEAIN
jgi:polyisoprenoid-binding protein YceI